MIVTESFAPRIDGVAHSVLRTAEHLAARGHTPVVVAPAERATRRYAGGRRERAYGYEVVRVPSLPLPGYPEVRVALPGRQVADAVGRFGPHVVHLAGPFVLGAAGAAAAARAGRPCVAVYQTDLAAYARTYLPVLGAAGPRLAWRRLRHIHASATRTLAPSRASLHALAAHGIPRIHLWPRGVDCARFHPRHRDEALRQRLGRPGEILIGYVGRLAQEKQLDRLAEVSRIPRARLVVVGDGPCRARLQAALPDAVFLGRRTGHELARLYASFDVFAHTGPFETFGQTLQEAMASGLPVVAPAAGGPLDLVRPGRTGFLVPPGTTGGFRDAVERLARDHDLRRAFGQAGRTVVTDRSWETVGDRLVEHYRLAVAETAGSLRC
ncbi:glycosyltransferase family 4 protein [Kitasatospora sp. NPDC048286]|uniref:glycosyltransferase family 4 protein n=1 Tax=Kitasatospora sp. NPDC048286 TaxID=3364047 RepID=UPI00371AE53E